MSIKSYDAYGRKRRVYFTTSANSGHCKSTEHAYTLSVTEYGKLNLLNGCPHDE